MSHHRIGLLVLAAALLLDAIFGWLFAVAEHLPLWHGLYIEFANAVTVGGDVNPARHAGYLINTAVFAVVDPLFAIAIGLFTSGLLAVHIRRAEARIHRHLSMGKHPDLH